MFDFKKSFSILIGKIIIFLLKISKSGATAAPGLYALKIDPRLLRKLQTQLKFSLVISGTNGKTTTARMIASIFKSAGIDFYHNRSGSNLLRGIVSTLISKITLSGRLSSYLGLWEVDEGVLPEALNQLKPEIVVLTNLFRDQLDRYFEIDALAKKWQEALVKLKKTSVLIINADDPSLSHITRGLKCKVVYYGITDKSFGSNILSHASDATFCPQCFLPLDYQTCFVSHLGIYRCRKCGQIQPEKNVKAIKAKFFKNKVCLQIEQSKKTYPITINLPGIYNIYNALAAFTAISVLKIPTDKIIQGFKNFRPAFGRFEQISLRGLSAASSQAKPRTDPCQKRKTHLGGSGTGVKINGKILTLMLIKNPAGFNQVLKTLGQLDRINRIHLLIALNDLIADGCDVSWIWDTDVKALNRLKIDKLIVSGTRLYDMAIRLKYALKTADIHLEASLKKAVNTLINPSQSQGKNVKNLYILATYTAMLEIRKILAQKNLVHSTWKD